MHTHDIYMRRCLQLALCGKGHTAPNPMVGSVIVHADLIVAEGYHQLYGGPHAEANAIAKIGDKALLKESCLYVNLEPCAHFGKTPPCADAIVQAGIPEVVIGSRDPFAEVDGKGIALLQAAGIRVTTGLLQEECRELNRRFFTFHEKRRPYIILKWAETADGYMGGEDKKPLAISNAYSRQRVHYWRSQEAAIMVGTHTALYDNPRLDVREVQGKDPVRIAIDRYGRIPVTHRLMANKAPTLIFTEREILKGREPGGAEYIRTALSGEAPLSNIMHELYLRGLQSLIVEGGARLINSLVNAGLWDEARVFRCPGMLGRGVKAPILPEGVVTKKEDIEGDELLIIRRNDKEEQ